MDNIHEQTNLSHCTHRSAHRIMRHAATLVICVTILAANIATAFAYDHPKSVTLTEAGTLSSLLTNDELTTTDDLTITGPINGSDIKVIRSMTNNLKSLNLKGANIVAGGSSYHMNYNTQNDVIGDYMFYAMIALEKIVMPKDVYSIGSWNNDNPWSDDKSSIYGLPVEQGTWDWNKGNSSYFGSAVFRQCVNLKEIEWPEALISISAKAFSNCIRLTSVSIPEGVEFIGNELFSGCYNLESASLPSTIGNQTKMSERTSGLWHIIGDGGDEASGYSYTFYNCSKLATVTLAEGMKYLMYHMFEGCIGITSVTLPSTLLRLNSAFYGCSGLTSLSFPSGLTEIGSLYGCSKITSIDLPENITISDISFDGMSALKSVDFKSNQGTSINDNTFRGCTSLTSISGYENVNSIGYQAFQNCSLLDIDLSKASNVETIGAGAFQYCKSLDVDLSKMRLLSSIGRAAFEEAGIKEVNLPEGIISIPEFTFKNCKQLTKVVYPAGFMEVSNNTFEGCENLSEVSLPTSLAYIRNNAFSGCTALKKITIPAAIQDIEDGAFRNCGITEVVLSEGLTNLGQDSFQGCKNLKKVTFPASMSSITGFNGSGIEEVSFAEGAKPEVISQYAFYNCSALKVVKLPETITEISDNAFRYCPIEQMNIPASLKSIGEYALEGCRLDSLKLGAGIEFDNTAFNNAKIGYIDFSGMNMTTVKDWFQNDDSLRVVKLPETATKIGDSAFLWCRSLTKVVLPDSLISIGDQAFYDCPIEQINLPASLDSIGNNALRSYKADTLKLGPNVKYIGNYAFGEAKIKVVDISEAKIKTIENWFQYNDSLRVVKLPETVTEIGDYAFENCPIKDISLPKDLQTIGKNSLYRCEIDTLILPDKLLKIGDNAFCDAKFNYLSIPKSVSRIGSFAFYNTEIKGALDITPNDTLKFLCDQWFQYYNFRCSNTERYLDSNDNVVERSWHLPAVYWNSTQTFPRDKFGNIDKLYLPTGGNVKSTYDIGYIFYNGMVPRIDLSSSSEYDDNLRRWRSYYKNDIEVNAQVISYRKDFYYIQSGYNESAGWNTIVLPFDVTEITYIRNNDSIPLAPFGSDKLNADNTLPFWLYELGSDGSFKAATKIEAHHPYIICMPNNDAYPEEYNISGTVYFSATNYEKGVTLGTTDGKLQRSKGSKFDFVPTYDDIYKSDSVYVLNTNSEFVGNDDKTYKRGSVFVRSYSNGRSDDEAVVSPFEAYLVSNEGQQSTTGGNNATSTGSAPEFYHIFGIADNSTGIAGAPIAPDEASKAYAVDGVLHIVSDKARVIKIYDPSGRAVRTVSLVEGDNLVTDLTPGIYLLEGQKVIIR